MHMAIYNLQEKHGHILLASLEAVAVAEAAVALAPWALLTN